MNSINENICKRNDILLNNKYNIIKEKNYSINLVIYYLNDNKIKIITRRLDNDNGWDYDLKIRLFSLKDDSSVVYSIGSSEHNSKLIEIYTSIKVSPKQPKEILIPKTIIQTNNKIIKNIKHYNSVCSLLEHNPDYEYIFFDDNRCRKFIKDNFKNNLLDKLYVDSNQSDVLYAYDYIIPGAIKADLFRYCYLYVNGGFYFDSKTICLGPIDDLINCNSEYLLCRDDAKNSIYNGIIGIKKNNLKMLNLIIECITNILNKNHCNDIHEPTGNKLLYKIFNDENMILSKFGENIKYNNELVLVSSYKNYYNENYNNFRIDWDNKKYYYKNIKKIGDFIFLINFNEYRDNFEIVKLKNNIFIVKRIDSDEGWDQKLEINYINLLDNKKYNNIIGSSVENEKVFILD